MAKSFDDLVKPTTTRKTRQRAEIRAAEILRELLLCEIRELTGKSQKQVADAIGIKQPSLSKLEKQSDMQISTLRRIINAMGGELEVLAKFPTAVIKIDQFGKAIRRARRARVKPGELLTV